MTSDQPPDRLQDPTADAVPAVRPIAMPWASGHQPPGAPHDPYGALRLGEFRRFLVGRFLDVLGGQMLLVAVGWELYERTGAAMALGLVGLAKFAPALLLALPAGHAADRYDRRRVMQVALAARACASLGLAAVSWTQAPVWAMYLCLVLIGAGSAVASPSYGALGAQLVPPVLYANATSWRSSTFELAAVGGPALGGLLLGVTRQPSLGYLLAALGALGVVVMLARIAPRPRAATLAGLTLQSLAEGVRFLARTPLLLATLTLDLFAVLLGGATTLLPVFARDILHVGPAGLGWLRAAMAAGAFAMAIVQAHRGPLRRAGPMLLAAVTTFGLATIVFGLSRSFPLSLLALFALGAADNVSVVVRSTLVQTLTPDALRGRVGAVNSIFIGASNELGGFESGALAALVGPVGSVVAGGVGTLAVVVAVAKKWPEVRRLGRIGGPLA